MNYKTIQTKVLQYKASTKRSERNKLITELLAMYAPIVVKTCNSTYDPEETKQIFIFEFIKQLDKYDPNNPKKAQFNTYIFPYIKSIRRLAIEQTGYFKYSKDTVYDSFYEDILLQDLNIDLTKILTPEEILVYNLNLKKPVAATSIITKIRAKVYNYLNNVHINSLENKLED